MAKRQEFKPDKPRLGFFSKLFLTRKQRKTLLKWLLYALILLLLSVVQDVILCRVRMFGAATELVPCGIFLICLAEGMESGSVFALIASSLYAFSGTAAGYYSIVLVTFLAVMGTYFRQAYLKKGFWASMLCAVSGVIVYEMLVFLIGVFLRMTTFPRIGGFFATAIMTSLFAPVLYPIVRAVSTIGGQEWKE